MIRKKKNIHFLLIAFAISWSSIIAINLFDDFVITVILIALWYMQGPLMATLILEKFDKRNLKKYFCFHTIQWGKLLLIPLLTVLFLFYFYCLIIVFGNFFHLEGFGELIFQEEDIVFNINQIHGELYFSEPDIPPNLFLFIMIAFLLAAFIGAIINFPVSLGEELGWRGFLLENNKEYTFFYKSIFIGFFWGLWHLPLILKGYNFNTFNLIGCLMMIIFCVIASFVFNYITITTKSVIAPTLFHGSINATVPGSILLINKGHDLISSPLGVSGILAMLLTSLTLFVFVKIHRNKKLNV